MFDFYVMERPPPARRETLFHVRTMKSWYWTLAAVPYTHASKRKHLLEIALFSGITVCFYFSNLICLAVLFLLLLSSQKLQPCCFTKVLKQL